MWPQTHGVLASFPLPLLRRGALSLPCELPRRSPQPPQETQLACLSALPPPSLLCGKEAAGAGVAAGASCQCDRAEGGTRGHVGKTLVPAALPARNAPPAPAPQPPPAWPRNGDSPAPCSHPLVMHPPQPTTGLVLAAQPPCLPAGQATCLAHPPRSPTLRTEPPGAGDSACNPSY
jgi:hypothetical protein